MVNDGLLGYRRHDGSVGIRNHVIILPVDDLSNSAAEGVAHLVPGVLAIPHAYGRLQFGADLDLHFRTLIGTGRNANVAAVIVIGIEPNWTERVTSGIEGSGKPVCGFSIERHGDLKTIATVARVARRLLQDASELRPESVDLQELVLSIKCGESDTTTGLASCPTVARVVDRTVEAGGTVIFGETSELTGGEFLVADRCATPELKSAFMEMYNGYIDMIQEFGSDLLGSQPTQGNIRGGLSTIEEKALGNIEKLGHHPVVGVLEPAKEPVASGLNFMDTSSAAAECVTLMAAAGAVLHLFPTGQGNIIGNPIEPVIKITGNPITAQTMEEHIDLDVSGLLRYDMTLDEAGDRLYDLVERTTRGRLTCAEALNHREFVLTKLYRSA